MAFYFHLSCVMLPFGLPNCSMALCVRWLASGVTLKKAAKDSSVRSKRNASNWNARTKSAWKIESKYLKRKSFTQNRKCSCQRNFSHLSVFFGGGRLIHKFRNLFGLYRSLSLFRERTSLLGEIVSTVCAFFFLLLKNCKCHVLLSEAVTQVIYIADMHVFASTAFYSNFPKYFL